MTHRDQDKNIKCWLRVIKGTLKGFNIHLIGISDKFEEIKTENFPEMKIQVPRLKMNSKYWTG